MGRPVLYAVVAHDLHALYHHHALIRPLDDTQALLPVVVQLKSGNRIRMWIITTRLFFPSVMGRPVLYVMVAHLCVVPPPRINKAPRRHPGPSSSSCPVEIRKPYSNVDHNYQTFLSFSDGATRSTCDGGSCVRCITHQGFAMTSQGT